VQLASFCLVRIPFLFLSPTPSREAGVYIFGVEFKEGLVGQTSYEFQGSMKIPASKMSSGLESLKVLRVADKNILMDELTACAGAP
jgi:hypothetical protein